jgi:hypothetical protein
LTKLFKKSFNLYAMETSKLSEYFYLACDRIHQVIDDLFESLHDEEGKPLLTTEQVEEAMEGVKGALYQELDLIKTIVDEYESQR